MQLVRRRVCSNSYLFCLGTRIMGIETSIKLIHLFFQLESGISLDV